MADWFTFWTHGINVAPKEALHTTGTDNGLRMMPHSWGMEVHQNPSTSNWFFLSIPTPTELDEWPSWNQSAFLRVRADSQVNIDIIEVSADTENARFQRIGKKSNFPTEESEFEGAFQNREDQITVDIPDKDRALGPLVMSIHVNFLLGTDADRTIVFKGAGARFKESRNP